MTIETLPAIEVRPAEPPRERTVSDVLLAAARYIEEHGWMQGDYRDAEGRVCMLGALRAITHESTEKWGAYHALADAIGGGVAGYNDTSGRTEAEVIAALRKAAE